MFVMPWRLLLDSGGGASGSGSSAPAAGAGQPPEGAAPPAPAAGGSSSDDAQQQEPKQESGTDVGRLNKELRDTRKEAQGLRDRIAAFEQAERERQDAESTELEKANRRISELEASDRSKDALVTELRTRMAVERQAARLGFADPEDAFRLLAAEEIEFDDKGQPTNVEALLTALKESKPYLAPGSTPAPPKGDFGNGQRGTQEPPRPATLQDAIAAHYQRTGGKPS